MNNSLQYIAIAAAIFVVALLILVIRLLKSVQLLNASFAKLGYTAREDAKKYFGDAADKVVDMNSGFNVQYQNMITEAMKKAMSESSVTVETMIAKAEQEANNTVLKAQEQAAEILATAKKESSRYNQQAISEATDTISWALQQYVHSNLSVAEHEDIIMQLVEKYTNERRN